MRITFLCASCRSELTVASHFAGRTILCPRCRRKTRIPTANAAPETTASPADSPTSASLVRESSNVFAKPCADFAPNPFAFSVRLETFAPQDGGEENASSAAETTASKTPSVNELIATLLEEENR
ncbi:MAG: hypothetical protein IJO40_11200 [Thermoguttaceae bacterium]|nr:hypothetical protein [Thermoguttaceae bacterium]